jgi:L,D-transpeptidase ErfK/SrfK
MRAFISVVVLATGLLAPASSRTPLPVSATIAGDVITYAVQPGDDVNSLSAAFGVEPAKLMADNRLTERTLEPGDALRIDNRHLVPASDASVVVSIAQRRLFHFTGETLRASYPVAVGRRATPTPTGPFMVVRIADEPSWEVPLTSLDPRRRSERSACAQLESSADNPMGRYWIGLSLSGIGIHGTHEPASVYRYDTGGCVRMRPEDMADLFNEIVLGDQGAAIYEPVLLGRVAGRIYLQAYADNYRREPNSLARVERTAAAVGFDERIDWNRVSRALADRDGGLVDVTMSRAGSPIDMTE